jgi:hypothetical protein
VNYTSQTTHNKQTDSKSLQSTYKTDNVKYWKIIPSARNTGTQVLATQCFRTPKDLDDPLNHQRKLPYLL